MTTEIVPPWVIDRLKDRIGSGTLQEAANEIARVTGEQISVSFLSNIIKGRRRPSDAVLEYIGVVRQEVYQQKG